MGTRESGCDAIQGLRKPRGIIPRLDVFVFHVLDHHIPSPSLHHHFTI
jgi:hypothetical protein